MIGNEDFYLNDKLVSVHLYYMEEYDKYIWTDEYELIGWFSSRKRKFKESCWINKENFCFYKSDMVIYKTDEELLKYINPFGVNKYSIRHNKKLYENPKIVFEYVNGDKRIYYFNKNSDAENFYVNFKRKYKENEYLIFE